MEILTDKEQIYIVDDDESVRNAVSLLLGTFGFEAQAFASADEFLSFVDKDASACLILDVYMAGMNGFALQQKLNAGGFRTPIIFISANKNLRLSPQYLKKAGAVGFLQKPFNDGALVDLINIAIKKRQCKLNKEVADVEI